MTAIAPTLPMGPLELRPGAERYDVVGGGAIVLALAEGDTAEVTSPAGAQSCLVAAFDSNGRSDPGLVGLSGAAPPQPLIGLLCADVVDARRVKAGLDRRGIDLESTRATELFGPSTGAGASGTLAAQTSVVCVIAAPGQAVLAEGKLPPSDLIINIQRAQIPEPGEEFLPAPLTDPNQDFRIQRTTATAYQVKAGQFIQIIDVAGRQCSDFQALGVRLLDAGTEAAIDSTTTRTLGGASYPSPGLFAKFFDANMAPMVELIQDTVGRHDTFNLACTAKYYEEMGYPGHVNCTDNINEVLNPYGVGPRRGWEAVNFFYNTNVDATNQIYLDEPWSRPGDYVLVRALQDLVCVSTACPCDVDAANGWDPTDIHIRVYPARNKFKKATAFRMTADAKPELTKETGFHPRTSNLTRNFTEYQGYWLANSYTNRGVISEYWACREAAAVIDLSPLRKYEVVGPDAQQLLQTCLTRNVSKLADGQVVYSAMCYPTGGMIDDGTLFRLGRENFRWIGGSDTSGLWLREQAQELGLKAWVKSSTNQLHNLQVQGPNSREILKDIVWTRPDQPTLAELAWFRFSVARLGGPEGVPLVVSRTGYTGELGYEIFCHPTHATEVWDSVWAAGQGNGLAPMGLEALDILRIEAGLVFAGSEFDDQTDPFEAGIGFTVPVKSKSSGFIGKKALLARSQNPQRKLVGLELEGGEIGIHGDTVHVGRSQVGVVTSGTISPVLAKNIALCRMSVEHAEVGCEVAVGKLDGHQKRIPAQVVRFPFYDPDKDRVRAN